MIVTVFKIFQEDKIKKLATKLVRVLSDKKRFEAGGGGGGGDGVMTGKSYGGGRDMETEELLEDHQHKIRELERQNAQLRDKLMVARQQLMAVSSGILLKWVLFYTMGNMANVVYTGPLPVTFVTALLENRK